MGYVDYKRGYLDMCVSEEAHVDGVKLSPVDVLEVGREENEVFA